jgi:alkaline phosphatase
MCIILFFIVSAARMYMGGEEVELSFEKFPHVGLSKVATFTLIDHDSNLIFFCIFKTYCVDRQVSDSAATATAFFTGVKANYATIGVNAKTVRYNCEHDLDKANHVEGLFSFLKPNTQTLVQNLRDLSFKVIFNKTFSFCM